MTVELSLVLLLRLSTFLYCLLNFGDLASKVVATCQVVFASIVELGNRLVHFLLLLSFFGHGILMRRCSVLHPFDLTLARSLRFWYLLDDHDIAADLMRIMRTLNLRDMETKLIALL